MQWKDNRYGQKLMDYNFFRFHYFHIDSLLPIQTVSCQIRSNIWDEDVVTQQILLTYQMRKNILEELCKNGEIDDMWVKVEQSSFGRLNGRVLQNWLCLIVWKYNMKNSTTTFLGSGMGILHHSALIQSRKKFINVQLSIKHVNIHFSVKF